MRDYELTVLLAGDLDEKEVDKQMKLLTDLLTKTGAKIKSKTDPVKKMLAYELKKMREGFYVYFELEMPTDQVFEVDSKIKLMDNVIRYLLVSKNISNRKA